MSIGEENITTDVTVRNEGGGVEDLVQVFINAFAEIDFTAGQGTDLPLEGDTVSDLMAEQADALLGHLKRNHVAELVAYQRHSAFANAVPQGAFDGNPGTARVEFQVNKRPDQQQERIRESGLDQRLGNLGDAGPEDFDDADNGAFASIMQGIDTLDFIAVPVGNPFTNGVDGPGGGAFGGLGQSFYRNYRNEYGRGPIFEASDTLQIGNGIHWDEMDEHRLRVEFAHSTWWDVFEKESETLREVQGLGD